MGTEEQRQEIRARLAESDKRRLDVACGALGRSTNSVIEEAVQAWLDEHWPEVELEVKKLSRQERSDEV